MTISTTRIKSRDNTVSIDHSELLSSEEEGEKEAEQDMNLSLSANV